MVSSDQQPNPSTASTRILPGLGAVREAANTEFPVYISSKLHEYVVQYLRKVIIPVVQHLKTKLHRHRGQRTRCTLVAESSRSYCSTTVVQYLEETTQQVRR